MGPIQRIPKVFWMCRKFCRYVNNYAEVIYYVFLVPLCTDSVEAEGVISLSFITFPMLVSRGWRLQRDCQNPEQKLDESYNNVCHLHGKMIDFCAAEVRNPCLHQDHSFDVGIAK